MSVRLRNLHELVVDRALLVRVSPTPITFAERRSVLQVLQRYGKVDFFQLRPFWNNNFVTLMNDKASAAKLPNLSPLKFRMRKAAAVVNTDYLGLGGASDFTKDEPPMTIMQNVATPAEATDSQVMQANAQRVEDVQGGTHEFHLFVQPLKVAEFDKYTYRSPMERSWPADYKETAEMSSLASILKQSVPSDMTNSEGLTCWLQDFDHVVDSAKSRIEDRRGIPSAAFWKQRRSSWTAKAHQRAGTKTGAGSFYTAPGAASDSEPGPDSGSMPESGPGGKTEYKAKNL